MALIRRWMEEDASRTALAESRRKLRNQLRQTKLEETWEMRKQLQQARLNEEIRRGAQTQMMKEKRIAERERVLCKQRERQEAILAKMTEQRRRERERLEADYGRKFAAKMGKKRLEATHTRHKQRKDRRSSRLQPQSNWDIQRTLLLSLSDDESELLRRSLSGDDRGEVGLLTKQSNESATDHSVIKQENQNDVSELGLGDFKEASFNEEFIRVPQQKTCEQHSIGQAGHGDFRGATFESDLELFITTHIVYPAYVRYYGRPNSPIPPRDHPNAEWKMESASSPEPDDTYESADESFKAQHQEEAFHRAVHFSFCAETIPLSPLREAYVPDQTDTSIDASSHLNIDEVSDENDECLSNIGLISRDSLTLLHGSSPPDTVLTQEVLRDLLDQILQALSSGLLTPEQILLLGMSAKNIISGLPIEQKEVTREETFTETELGQILTLSDISEISPQQRISSTSILADELVQHTLSLIAKQLHKPDTDVMKSALDADIAAIPLSAMHTLVQFIVECVDGLAVKSVTTELEPQAPCTTSVCPRPGSAPPTPNTDRITRVTPVTATANTVMSPTHTTTSDLKTGRMVSETTHLVRNVLSNVLRVFCDDGVESGLSWDADIPLSAPGSSASATTQLVKTTIGGIMQELEEETAHTRAKQSVSSVLVDSLVTETLQQCINDLKCSAVPTGAVNDLAIAIIQSHKTIKQQLSMRSPHLPEHTRSMSEVPQKSNVDGSSNSSVLVSTLIQETLQRLKTDLENGAIASQDATVMAQELGYQTNDQVFPKSSLPNETRSVTNEARSDTSSLAERSVFHALKDMLTPQAGCPPDVKDADETSESEVASQKLNIHTADSNLAIHAITHCINQILGDLGSNIPVCLSSDIDTLQSSGSSVSSCKPTEVDDTSKQIPTDTVQRYCDDKLQAQSNSSKKKPFKNANTFEQGHFHQEHIVVATTCEESSEDEVEINPVLDGKPIQVDHHIVEDALSILSVKKDADLDHSLDPTARNSFRDLLHPELSKVRRLSHTSEKEICSRIMTLSSLHIAHPLTYDLHEEEMHDPTNKEYHSAPDALMRLTSSSSSLESDDEGTPEEGAISVVTIHTPGSEEEGLIENTHSKNVSQKRTKQQGNRYPKTFTRKRPERATESTGLSNKSSKNNQVQTKPKQSAYERNIKGSSHTSIPKPVSSVKKALLEPETEALSSCKRDSKSSIETLPTSVQMCNASKQPQLYNEPQTPRQESSSCQSDSQMAVAMKLSGNVKNSSVPKESHVTLHAKNSSDGVVSSKVKKTSKMKISASSSFKNCKSSSSGLCEFTTSATHLPVSSNSKSQSHSNLKSSSSSTHRSIKQSHQIVNLTPRPSSAYRKSPSAHTLVNQQPGGVRSRPSQTSTKTSSPASSLQSLTSLNEMVAAGTASLPNQITKRARHTSEESGRVSLSSKASISSLMHDVATRHTKCGRAVICTNSDTKAMIEQTHYVQKTSTTSLPHMASCDSSPMSSSATLKLSKADSNSQTILGDTHHVQSKTSIPAPQ